MCTYTGEKDDPMRHSPDDLLDDVVDCPAGENPLLGFRALHLESTHQLADKLTAVEHLPLNPTIKKIKALLGNGLNGIDLVRVWVTWRILPLSRRSSLMCTYTCEKHDPMRHSPDDLPDDVVDATTQSLLKEGWFKWHRSGPSLGHLANTPIKPPLQLNVYLHMRKARSNAS